MKSLKIIAPLLFACVIIAFLFAQIEGESLLRALREGDKVLLMLGLIPLFLAHLFSIWRWKSLVDAYGVTSRFGELARIYFANLPIAKWTPMYSGDFLRALYLKEKLPSTEGAAIVAVESFIDVFVLLFFVLVSAVVRGAWTYAGVALLGILGLGIGVYLIGTPLFSRMPFFSRSATRIAEVFRFFRQSPGRVARTFFITVLSWLQISLFIKIMFLAFGYPTVSLFYILTVQPLVTLVALLPVTLGGLGTREAAMLFFYTALVPPPVVFLIALLYSTMSLIVFPVFGLFVGFSEIKKLFSPARS